jgi:hypothetical protein
MFIIALTAFFGVGYLIHRYEEQLVQAAEREFPGPLVALIPDKIPPGTHRAS